TMRKEFYDLRGWETESGLQKTETLAQLGLSDIVADLKKMGLIATT
ncbi:MAG: hypothetical protein H8E17_01480, partial [Deltaproteobacteria bacterium]|nr:hypothetical protein [Deltaproteobacteria bacterium]